MFFKKWKAKRIKRKWKREEDYRYHKKVYRYLRFHKELLDDPAYKEMYEHCRLLLVVYLKCERKVKGTNEKVGELVDVLADISNRSDADCIEEYKPLVENFYGKLGAELKELLANQA